MSQLPDERADTDSKPSPAERPENLWREVVGEELRTIRRSRRETLQSVARRASVSPQYVSEIERGLKEPSSEILAAIGASLGISLLELTIGVASRLYGEGMASRSVTQDNVVLAA